MLQEYLLQEESKLRLQEEEKWRLEEQKIMEEELLLRLDEEARLKVQREQELKYQEEKKEKLIAYKNSNHHKMAREKFAPPKKSDGSGRDVSGYYWGEEYANRKKQRPCAAIERDMTELLKQVKPWKEVTKKKNVFM